MTYFHTNDLNTIHTLADALNHAAAHGKRVRLNVEGGSLTVKIGEGVWSAPFTSDPDPYRDQS